MIAGKELPGGKAIGRKGSNTRVGAERPSGPQTQHQVCFESE